MTHLCPECSEIVEDCGGAESGDEIVKCYACDCGCSFDVTYRDPWIDVTQHGKSWDGKES